MDIALLIKDQKQLNLKKRSLSSNDSNEDLLWIGTIVTNVLPFNDNYLYIKHVKTGFRILQFIEGNAKNKRNIEEHLKKAFRRFIDWTKQMDDIDPGTYEAFLENINFVSIPNKYQYVINEIRKDKQDIIDDFYKTPFPLDYYNPILSNDYIISEKNFEPEASTGKIPFEEMKTLLKNYQGDYKKKEVDFKENLQALERPKFDRVTNMDPEKLKQFEENAHHLVLDNTLIVPKEPMRRNQRIIEKLNRRIIKLSRTLNLNKNNPRTIKKINKLYEEISNLMTYYPSPYSGEYKNLIIPEEMPENPALEFLITLDTGLYLAKRRIIVPSDMSFKDFDRLLSYIFRWGGFPYHLSEFIFPLENSPEGKEASEVLIWMEEDYPKQHYLWPADNTYRDNMNPFYGVPQTNIKDKKLNDYFPKFRTAQYRYDFGDNWYHSIELVGIHDSSDYKNKLPYLLDSVGQAPIDDIGGPRGFHDFRTLELKVFDPDQFINLAFDWYLNEYSNILQAPCNLAELFENVQEDEEIEIIFIDE